MLSDGGVDLDLEHTGEDFIQRQSFDLLVGYRGKLYEIQSDFSVNIYVDPWIAIGAIDVALGAMYATRGWTNARKRIQTALDATARYTTSVGPPMTIEVLK